MAAPVDIVAVLVRAREVIATYVAPDARSIIADIDAALVELADWTLADWSQADHLDACADRLAAEAAAELEREACAELNPVPMPITYFHNYRDGWTAAVAAYRDLIRARPPCCSAIPLVVLSDARSFKTAI